MDPIPLITEVKPSFFSRQTGEQPQGEQQQRLPFTPGQMLQATVIAKSEAFLVTLNLNGQQVTAESSIPLQVGQQIDLQIAALTPRLELQVVNPAAANRWLGNVLPLLGKEFVVLPQLTELAGDARLMAQLRPEIRETLLLFAGQRDAGGMPAPAPASAPASASASASAVPAMVNQLAELLVQKTLPAPEPNPAAPLQGSSAQPQGSGPAAPAAPAQGSGPAAPAAPQTAQTPAQGPSPALNPTIPLREIFTLLQNAGSAAPLAPQTATEAGRLADLFALGLAEQKPATPEQAGAARLAMTDPKATGAILDALTTLAKFAPTHPTLPAQLLSLQQAYASLPADHPLQQLLSFLVRTTGIHLLPTLAQGAGEDLGERLNRLGLNMEQLLAGDKPEEATRTLKFALLDLAQQAEAAAGKGGAAPNQLVQLLELYQLVQHRLAGESLIFLPLPFLFLQQGYALVESDRHDDEEGAANRRGEQANRTVALHLRLEGLGNLQIDIRQQGDDKFTLRFLAEDMERAKFIAGFRQELEQWLTSGALESVQFLVGAQAPTKTLLEKIMPDGASMINTKV